MPSGPINVEWVNYFLSIVGYKVMSMATPYRVLVIFDGEDFEDEVGIRKGSGPVARGSNHIYIRCIHDVVKVSVSVRFWEGNPEVLSSEWEAVGHGVLRIDSGILSIGQLDGEVAEVEAPVSGNVQVRVSGRGREELKEKVRWIEEDAHARNISTQEEVGRMRQLDGLERYLIDVYQGNPGTP